MDKSNYFGNLNQKNINDENKKFKKTIKPFLSDKVKSTNKMTLLDKEEIIAGDYNTAKVFNTFFPNIVSNLKGYLRYKKITSQNVSSDAQVKNFFISQESYVPFSRDSRFSIFNNSMIYLIRDVMMGVST